MPSEDWLKENPKVSTHIPQHLYDELLRFMADQSINSTAKAVKLILKQYLSSQQQSKVDHSVDHLVNNRLKTIEEKVSEISRLLAELTSTHKNKNSSPLVGNPLSESSPLVDNSRQLSSNWDWLTTGEAYAEAQRQGYTKSLGTFRRSLRDWTVPPELERLGLVANWDIRTQANPKDKSVKWLRFNLD